MASDLLVPGQKFMLIEGDARVSPGYRKSPTGIYAGWGE